jgi:hypothetical protein
MGLVSSYSNTHLELLVSYFPSWEIVYNRHRGSAEEWLTHWRKRHPNNKGPEVWYCWNDRGEIEIFERRGSEWCREVIATLIPVVREKVSPKPTAVEEQSSKQTDEAGEPPAVTAEKPSKKSVDRKVIRKRPKKR